MKLYTSNPNEVETHTTVPAPADVAQLVQAAIPELTPAGAKTITAQFMHETGGGRFCFNWNLGNFKAHDTDPHMYLMNVWELDTPERAGAQVTQANGLARIATAAECKQHGWAHGPDKVVVVFQPPHAQCRFRAYPNLAEGAARWAARHRSIAASHPDYLERANAGDCAGVAHILKLASYYTGDETAYARSMSAQLARLNA